MINGTRGDNVPEKLTIVLIVLFLGKTSDLERVSYDLKAARALEGPSVMRHWIVLDGARFGGVELGGVLQP